ncbi:MAG: HPr family phosphocarrier protein [Lachnospiraceae bacterium]|nr:HPr family phosphocarrier protein [Lachnospiraceae bacterium]
MKTGSVTVHHRGGLDLRPAGLLCAEAMKFKAQIIVTVETRTANAKSIISLIGAHIDDGDEVFIRCDGDDEAEALAAIIDLFENGLDR